MTPPPIHESLHITDREPGLAFAVGRGSALKDLSIAFTGRTETQNGPDRRSKNPVASTLKNVCNFKRRDTHIYAYQNQLFMVHAQDMEAGIYLR